MSDTATLPPLKTLDEICEALRKILTTNDVKPGTKRARTIECSFLQGLMVGNAEYAKCPFIIICLLSGRSILN